MWVYAQLSEMEFGTLLLDFLVSNPAASAEKRTSLVRHSLTSYMPLENYEGFVLAQPIVRALQAELSLDYPLQNYFLDKVGLLHLTPLCG